MKIAIMYLDVPNLGDLIIYETARYIIEGILSKYHVENYEIIPVDISSYKGRTMKGGLKLLDAPKEILTKMIDKLSQKDKFFHYFPTATFKLLKKKWHWTVRYKYYVQFEKPKLKDVDIIVFGGGGLIKFHQQNFHFYIDDITVFAEKANIPVLLNAQGIEGYDENDPNCQILKAALNRNCVKYISTRDDLAMLSTCYISNSDIEVEKVCDPAFWIREAYSIKARSLSAKKIGINVIRSNIWSQYLYPDINRSMLGELYYDLIRRLYQAKYEIELFSNGIETDTKFIKWLLKKYPDLQEKYHITIAAPQTPAELIRLIDGYDRVLAVRLHSAIIGTVLGIPNVSIVWNRKQLLFGQEINMPQNFITREELQSDVIFQRLLNAKPYQMNAIYKESVYQSLETQLKKWLILDGGGAF